MNNLAALEAFLQTPRKICVVSHYNPDGDAVGSVLGLSLFLEKWDHCVTAVVPNDFPHFLKWLPQQEQIVRYQQAENEAQRAIMEADLIFTLDFNDFSRCGDVAQALRKTKADFVMIDHHQQPTPYAKYMYSDDQMGSTCEMVFHFIHSLDKLVLIDQAIATCLYVGIMTDSGSFRFPATTSTTHRVVAQLIDKGADNVAIHQHTMDVNSYQRMQLLGVALTNLVVLKKHKTAYTYLSKKELEAHDYKKGDTEGFVNYGLSMEGIHFAVIFIESLEEDLIKISFRSKGEVDVNQFARNHFEGGGHKNAAGGKSNLSLSETIKRFKQLVHLQEIASV